jgi:hypothetical protein
MEARAITVPRSTPHLHRRTTTVAVRCINTDATTTRHRVTTRLRRAITPPRVTISRHRAITLRARAPATGLIQTPGGVIVEGMVAMTGATAAIEVIMDKAAAVTAEGPE